MGKPYQSEISRLPETFGWAIAQPVEGLAKSLRSIGQTPLIVVGSGGSLAACHFAAQLRQQCAGVLAKAMTPLEFSQSARELKSSAVMVISAGGRNPDIIEAFRAAAIAEVPRIILIAGNAKSPLVSLAKRCDRADVHTFAPPTGKDGFLATNSLLSFYTILYRAQLAAAGVSCDADNAFDSVLPDAAVLSEIEKRSRKLWDRDHLIILHGPSLLSVGADLESRFAEAALGTVQKADYRNFAHGQHYWLAKRSKETALIAFVTSSDREIADKTLALIPSAIPQVKIDVPGEGLASSLWGLVASMQLAGFAGLAKGVDPGRPVVPDFGRKLYHLKTRSSRIKTTGTPPSDFVVSRKNDHVQNPANVTDGQSWSEALSSFRRRIEAARYCAVVFDYDGTLCNRVAALSSSNVEQFLRLAGDEFEELVAQALLKKEPLLTPERQHAILVKGAGSFWKDIPRRARNAREVLVFLDSIGRFCRWTTYQPNAPYSPGVNGIAISMADRERLLTGAKPRNGQYGKLADVLAACLAQNLLDATLNYKCKGVNWMVLYLNRLLCAHFGLPLGYGGFREKKLKDLATWLDPGYREPKKDEQLI